MHKALGEIAHSLILSIKKRIGLALVFVLTLRGSPFMEESDEMQQRWQHCDEDINNNNNNSKRDREQLEKENDDNEPPKDNIIDSFLAFRIPPLEVCVNLLAQHIEQLKPRKQHKKGDLAYWIPKLEMNEQIKPGQVVAILSKGHFATSQPPIGSDVLAWTAVAGAEGGPVPLVVGNPFGFLRPDDNKNCVLVAYVGHVRLYCNPDVKCGQPLFATRGESIAHSMPESLLECSTHADLGYFGWALSDYIPEQGMLDAFISVLPGSETKVAQQILDDAHIKEFKRVPVTQAYESAELKLFCNPLAHITLKAAIVDHERDESLRGRLCAGWSLHQDKSNTDSMSIRVLQGEAGVGKTVWLQQLCRGELVKPDYFHSDDVLLYLDLALIGDDMNLETIVEREFRIKNPHFLRRTTEALKRQKERVVYCFDSFHLASEKVKHLFVERKLPWVRRCIIASRPREGHQLLFSLAQQEKPVSTCTMEGFQSESAINLMWELVASSVKPATVVTTKLPTGLGQDLRNPLLNQLLFMARIATPQSKGDHLPRFMLFKRALIHWYCHAGDPCQQSTPLALRDKGLSYKAQKVLGALAWYTLLPSTRSSFPLDEEGLHALVIQIDALFIDGNSVTRKMRHRTANDLCEASVRKELSDSGLLEQGHDYTRHFCWYSVRDYLAANFIIVESAHKSVLEAVKAALDALGTPRVDLHDFFSFLLEISATIADQQDEHAMVVETVLDWLLSNANDDDGPDRLTILHVVSSGGRNAHNTALQESLVARLRAENGSQQRSWLRVACQVGSEPVIKALLPSVCKEKEEDISSPRHIIWQMVRETCCSGHAHVLKLLVPCLPQDARHNVIQEGLLWSLRFANVECARLLISEHHGSIAELGFYRDGLLIADLLCEPSIIPLLVELKFDLNKVHRFPDYYVDSDGAKQEGFDCVDYPSDWGDLGCNIDDTLMEHALKRKRWDVVRALTKLDQGMARSALEHAFPLNAEEDEDLLAFFQQHCSITDQMVTEMRAEHQVKKVVASQGQSRKAVEQKLERKAGQERSDEHKE